MSPRKRETGKKELFMRSERGSRECGMGEHTARGSEQEGDIESFGREFESPEVTGKSLRHFIVRNTGDSGERICVTD